MISTDYGKNLWATLEVGLEALQADEELVSDGSLYIDVNYAHDWVNVNTDPYATVVITLTDAGLQ